MTALDERQVCALTAYAIGPTQPQAARLLGICERSVRRYLTTATTALEATSPVHALALAAARGLIDPDHLRLRTPPPWPHKRSRS